MRSACFLLVVFTAACSIDLMQPAPSAWQARTLLPGGSLATAEVLAASQFGNTEVTIQLDGAEPGVEYRWHIRRGTCEVPDLVFGGTARYPLLQVPEGGSLRVTIHLAGMMDPAGPYTVEIELEGGTAEDPAGVCEPLAPYSGF